MLVELILAPLIIAFLLVAALGHVLLTAAIHKCLHEDYIGGRGQRTAERNPTPADNAVARAAGAGGFIETVRVTEG